MEGKFRLLEEEMISDDHFPVVAIFNMIRDVDFIETLEWISSGHGFGENYGACTFPNDQDEYDIATRGKLDGVEFGLHSGQEVTLDYNTFYHYLKKVCNDYAENFPNNKDLVNGLLAKFKALYRI